MMYGAVLWGGSVLRRTSLWMQEAENGWHALNLMRIRCPILEKKTRMVLLHDDVSICQEYHVFQVATSYRVAGHSNRIRQ
jgi:hypothetical protein